MKNRTKMVVASYVGRLALGSVIVAAYSWLPAQHASVIIAMTLIACVGVAATCSVSEFDRLDRLYCASIRLKNKLDNSHWTDAHIRRSPLGQYVAYDEAGLEHSRHDTHGEARIALEVHGKTLENDHE